MQGAEPQAVAVDARGTYGRRDAGSPDALDLGRLRIPKQQAGLFGGDPDPRWRLLGESAHDAALKRDAGCHIVLAEVCLRDAGPVEPAILGAEPHAAAVIDKGAGHIVARE